MIELDEREQEDGIIPIDGVSKSEVIQEVRQFNKDGARPSKKYVKVIFILQYFIYFCYLVV